MSYNGNHGFKTWTNLASRTGISVNWPRQCFSEVFIQYVVKQRCWKIIKTTKNKITYWEFFVT